MATNLLPHFLLSVTEASVVFLAPCDFLAANTFPDIFTYGKFFHFVNIYKHLDGLVKMTLFWKAAFLGCGAQLFIFVSWRQLCERLGACEPPT